MLVSLEKLLIEAKKNQFAVGAFNCPNLETITAVIKVAEEINCPVVLSHSEIHNSVIPIEKIAPMMLDIAKNAMIPVFVHLDHGTSFEMCIKAIRLGFCSVMYDASNYDFDTNVSQTKEMVRIAHASGVSVEADLGQIFSSTKSKNFKSLSSMYTNPRVAKNFVESTKVDALAISYGTSQDIYKTKPVLDLNRIRQIKSVIDVPLVLHSGTDFTKQDFSTAHNNGFTKINYYTYMKLAGGQQVVTRLAGLSPDDSVYSHNVPLWAQKTMSKNVREAMKIFSIKEA